MRILDVFRLALDSIGLVIILGICVTMLWLIGYKLLYKKVFGGSKTLKAEYPGLWMVFFIYIVVVLSATMISRHNAAQGVEFVPFASYRQAWNRFSPKLWRNIFLNIAMFVPFGCILPIVSLKCRKFWVTYGAGFGFTLFIEGIQFLTGRGVFETDDLINNTFGAMVGFGCYKILQMLYDLWKKKPIELKKCLLAQMPLLCGVITFGGIFLSYERKDLGNLSFAYTQRVNMAKVQVQLETDLENKDKEEDVYRLHVASLEETRQKAELLFSRAGGMVDDERTDIYDETVVYYDKNGNGILWIDYQGCCMDYSIPGNMWIAEQEEAPMSMWEDASREEVADILREVGISISEEFAFEEVESGIYFFSANKIVAGDVMYHGKIQIQLNEEKQIVALENNLITYHFWGSYEIRSEREAYDDFLAGKFQAGWKQEFSRVIVEDVNLQYWIDTKGYFQPVYAFDVALDGSRGVIYLKAIKD